MTTTFSTPGTQEVLLTHVFDAPRDRVYRAHIDAEAIAHWWGPRELTTEVDALDPKPGGRWRFINRDASGADHAFHGVFHDLWPDERIVQTFEYEGVPGRVLLSETVLEDVAGGTLLTQRAVYLTAADREAMVSSGMQGGLVASMERLGELLAGRDA